jgi:glycosyltransferase involved in cell wall biosynthesis
MTAIEIANSLSIIIPAKNEVATVGDVVTKARESFPEAEVIVVDDGSTDGTGDLAERAGATVIRHPESLGNGASVKTGARLATGKILAFMDADGQHDAKEFSPLLERLADGYHMVVGARNAKGHASVGRLFANGFYNSFASIVSGRSITDLTSGFRVARSEYFKQFLYLLPNGFSYPTTITMAFLRSGYPVGFVPIFASRRTGKSHIRPLRDGLRFLIIIFKIATLYAPLKIFLPVSAMFFTTGLAYYAYTYITMGRFTNMSLLVFSASVIVFLIGLISEQITALMYSNT